MGFLAALGIGVVALFCVLAALVIRRALIVWSGGSIVMNVRLSTRYRGRGWAPGLGRFVGDELRWHRIFSLSLRPRTVLRRADVQVRSRRTPDEMELLALPDDCVVLRCETKKGQLDIAMRHSALNGFLSWLEAAPPGAASRRLMVY
ncbi:MAG TPA: DUF2550 domain-containing protein [Micromonosporaceae bacterium]|jgi:hypothetical protein|nr:DUF2550 domain-containing protein [Micromonosporaceae bacterium]